MNDKATNLHILEAYVRDVGTGVARIDHYTFDSLGASSGDVIEIKGKSRTVAKCLPIYPPDEGKKILRVDGLIRNNAGIAIGDTVSIKKIDTLPAEKVTVMPLESMPPIDERYLADALDSVPVTKNDNVMVPYFGGRLTFQIVGTIPDTDVIIAQKTLFTIMNKTIGLVPSDCFVYPQNPPDSEKLVMLRDEVEKYEKELAERQDEIKNISREMLSKNQKVEDVQQFLYSNMIKGLHDTYDKLLDTYRKYVSELESINRK